MPTEHLYGLYPPVPGLHRGCLAESSLQPSEAAAPHLEAHTGSVTCPKHTANKRMGLDSNSGPLSSRVFLQPQITASCTPIAPCQRRGLGLRLWLWFCRSWGLPCAGPAVSSSFRTSVFQPTQGEAPSLWPGSELPSCSCWRITESPRLGLPAP